MGREARAELVELMDVVIRQETADDREAVDEVVRLAFGGELEATLVQVVRAWDGFVPELSLVAHLDGRVVGHVLFTPIAIEGEGTTHALCMAPVAVHPDVQNKAIGSRLVREGLERCRALAHRIVIVQGRPNYYPRFGFAPARPLGVAPPSPLPDPVWMVTELVEGALAGVRGTVRYPPPFDVLESKMSADDVLEVLERLNAAGVRCWLDGGWGVDALVWEQTRDHSDLDLVVPLDEVDAVIAAVAPLGFKVLLDQRPARLLLRDGNTDRRIDLHPVVFDGKGNGRQIGAGPNGGDAPYPAAGFAGNGRVGGREVACLTPELLLMHHTGYPPKAKDRHNVGLLCERFGVALPKEYESGMATD